MSKFTLTIKENETGKTDTYECNSIFCGYANGQCSGAIARNECKGLEICLAANAAERAIKSCEEKDEAFRGARKVVGRFLSVIEKEVEKDEERK